jgi:hypothetical protein
MTRGLVAKELRQHAFTLAFLFLVLLVGLAAIVGNSSLRRSVGVGFEAVHLLLCTFVPIACLVLGQVLIATEFRQQTQLFLEGLPLPRWRMLAVKFALGLGVLIAAVAAALYVAWLRARGAEAMTLRFATLLALKSAGWVWFFYTLCFVHSFLGRYRIPFGVALFFAWLGLNGAGVNIAAFGPFALVDQRFAYEREVLPVEELVVTAALGLGLAVLGFGLGLVRDATVASLLAEKMSSREKVFMTFLIVAMAMLGAYLFEHYKNSTPVQMPGATEARHGVVLVLASAAVDAPTREESAALEHVAKRAAEELGALADYLGCKTFPPVFIVHRRDLKGGEWSDGELKPTQGVLVRANLTDKAFDETSLHTWLVRQTLLAQSSGLAGRERHAWVLDGIGEWWPRRDRGLDDAWLAPARQAMPADFSARHLAVWFTLSRAAGEKPARELAATGLTIFGQRHGTDALRRFLSAMYVRAQPNDFRGWFSDILRPARSRLHSATGVDEKAFVAEWRAALATAPSPP